MSGRAQDRGSGRTSKRGSRGGPRHGHDDAFSSALREALARSGLSLERVSERLRGQGVRVSPASLSSWQRGLSRPERPHSMRALEALEVLLDLPTSALRSRLGPRRPRGRLARSPQPPFTHPALKDSTAVRALAGDPHGLDPDVQSVLIHDTLTVGEGATMSGMSSTNVLRATRHGADRALFIHRFDDFEAEPRNIEVMSGLLGDVQYLRESRTLVIEVRFGHALPKLGTTVVNYRMEVSPSGVTSDHHERWVRTNLHAYLLQVRFHPNALPVRCHAYVREQGGTAGARRRRVPVDATNAAHVLTSRCRPGIHGMSWEFPP
ncbi:helix-turn-helix domain-containing protein [Streptomyces sp. NPDC127068]|uniref:helix-turn-helix domain-containing protein n=1 Tax=Streptomyces sp. NPDC127068 TaxID=3347127 RepID=UPI00365E5570